MATSVGSGTQTCVIGTEHTLYDSTTDVPGSFVAGFNTVNMVNGDEFELRFYSKVLTGDTLAVIGNWSIGPISPIDEPIVQLPPLLAAFQVRVTIKQTTGTGRNVPWHVYKL